jgi:5-methyltetrahydrofolate--homocysteine methyltransferase
MSPSLRELFAQNRPILCDGATGSFLRQLGLPKDVAPEAWVIENAAMVYSTAEAYVKAGAQIILTCTFGATAFRLIGAGLEAQSAEINRSAAHLAREAAHGNALVAGDIGPLGYLALSLGAITYTEAIAQFAEQAHELATSDVDLFHIESMSDLQEMRAAITGVRQVSELPIFVTLSFDSSGKTLLGVTPAQAAKELASWHVDAVGANCGNGPWEMPGILQEMRAVLVDTPLIAKPNAGMPEHRKEGLVYPVDPLTFAVHAREWVRGGAKVVGGCCGTTPEYIAAIRSELDKKSSDREQIIIS